MPTVEYVIQYHLKAMSHLLANALLDLQLLITLNSTFLNDYLNKIVYALSTHSIHSLTCLLFNSGVFVLSNDYLNE